MRVIEQITLQKRVDRAVDKYFKQCYYERVAKDKNSMMITKEFLMENGVDTLKDVKALESIVKEMKSEYKEKRAAKSADMAEATIAKVNEMIVNGTICVGSKIMASYKDRVIKATVRTIPTVKSKNLSVESDELDNKTGRFYLVKSKFICFEDEQETVEEVEKPKAVLIKASELDN